MFESVESVSHHLIGRAAKNTTADDHFNLAALFDNSTIHLVTTVILFLLNFAVHYIFGLLVPALAAIEDTQAADYAPVKVYDADDDLEESKIVNGSEDPSTVPITAGLFSSIRHLRNHAGRLSVFRGIGLYLVYFITNFYLGGFLFGSPQGRFVLPFLSHMITEVIMANLILTWIHVVISKPSKSWWIKRIPGFDSWKAFAPAVAVRSLVTQLCQLLIIYLRLFRLDYIHLVLFKLPGSLIHSWPMLSGSIAWLLASFVLTILVEAPATIIMIRIGASLLPANVETIVPFDRTFGGKVVPAVQGRFSPVGMLDAWRTFKWPSRVRFAKLVARAVGVMLIIYVVANFFLSMTASRKGWNWARWVKTYGGWRWT